MLAVKKRGRENSDPNGFVKEWAVFLECRFILKVTIPATDFTFTFSDSVKRKKLPEAAKGSSSDRFAPRKQTARVSKASEGVSLLKKGGSFLLLPRSVRSVPTTFWPETGGERGGGGRQGAVGDAGRGK